jgi:two-component system, cell cycle response regulator
MSVSILTVDDSRAVRMIVKKAFKSYACDIHEAGNGVEGLALAEKVQPDLILLDITMPVMDGVEMLTKLKSDRALKHIPVIMLTAEAGRQTVMKIAKLGIRDYIVKPFQESVLVGKVNRVVELRPAEEKRVIKKITDAVNLVLVDDKPAIIQQFRDRLAHLPWEVHGAASTGETIDICNKITPDVIVISLSLPDDAGLSLFRILRSESKTKFVPIFGMVVKTDKEAQEAAQKLGFTNMVTKPIDFGDLEMRVSKAINLDTSERYFIFGEDYLTVQFPETPSPSILAELQEYLREKISDAVDRGFYKIVIDGTLLKSVSVDTIKMMIKVQDICNELTLNMLLVGSKELSNECAAFEETQGWTFHPDINTAMAEPMGV